MFRLIASLFAALLLTSPAAAQLKLAPPPVVNTLAQPIPVPPFLALPYEDAQVLAGRGYSVSTAVVAVAANNFLTVELANPVGSGVNYVMSARVFSDNVIGGAAPLEYQRFGQDAVFPTGTATSVTVGNRITGQPAATGTFRYMMGAAAATGTVTSSGFIPTNGEEKRIKDIVVIAPGNRLVYSIGGAGGGLAAATRIAVTFLFWTTPT